MSVLRPPATPTAQLTFLKNINEYVGEISSTNGFGRVYDDACDEGLTLVGKTGRAEVFAVTHTERDRDGDVRWWLLRCVSGTYATTVRLFND